MRLLGTLFLQMSSIIPPVIGLQRKERETALDQFNHYGGTKMKTLKIALVALMLTGFFGTQAKAQNRTVWNNYWNSCRRHCGTNHSQ